MLFYSVNSLANTFELFGASSETMAIGNQAGDLNQVSNHYYAPALLGFQKDGYSLGFTNVIPRTKEINNVIITSPMNSNSSYQTGDVEQNTSTLTGLSLHALFPFIYKAKLGVSLFLPIDKFAEVSTGDTYLPEYAMYRSRSNRTLLHGSLIIPYDNTFSMAIGFHTGLQSNGETELIGRNSGSDEPSSGKLVFNASPGTALTFSVAKKFKDSHLYFSFQDYMRSDFKNKAFGYTPLDSSASSFPFNLNMNSLLYFDPRIIRAGYVFHQKELSYFTSLEYQDWSAYESPKLKLESNGGVIISSQDFEEIKGNKIFIPHLGLAYKFNDQSLSFGTSFRPRAIESNLNESGNTIDSDLLNFSLGHSISFLLLDKMVTFNSSYLLQMIQEYDVVKTPNREDGESGQKLGSPGYTVGGQIHVLSFGLSWVI